VRAHHVAADAIKVRRGHAGARFGFHGFEHEPDDTSGGAHGGKFFGCFDGQS
jgi:hypothetical protein